jgi:hypothetical protein
MRLLSSTSDACSRTFCYIFVVFTSFSSLLYVTVCCVEIECGRMVHFADRLHELRRNMPQNYYCSIVLLLKYFTLYHFNPYDFNVLSHAHFWLYRTIGLILDSIHLLVCRRQKTTTFWRLDLCPFSGGWGRINLLSWAR